MSVYQGDFLEKNCYSFRTRFPTLSSNYYETWGGGSKNQAWFNATLV